MNVYEIDDRRNQSVRPVHNKFCFRKKKRSFSDSAIIAQLRVFFEILCTISLYEHCLSKILSSLSTKGSSISVLNLGHTFGLR